jgi:hypothetical protein
VYGSMNCAPVVKVVFFPTLAYYLGGTVVYILGVISSRITQFDTLGSN